jgi:hypothetical protein
MNVPIQLQICSENRNNGTERLARDRESEHCSVPIPCSESPGSVPIERAVDAFLAARQRERSDNWSRDELLILVSCFKSNGPKGVSRLLVKRSTRAVESMAERLGLKSDIRPGRRPGSTP